MNNRNLQNSAHVVVLYKSLCTLRLPRGDVYHLWQADQDYHIVTLDIVKL